MQPRDMGTLEVAGGVEYAKSSGKAREAGPNPAGPAGSWVAGPQGLLQQDQGASERQPEADRWSVSTPSSAGGKKLAGQVLRQE